MSLLDDIIARGAEIRGRVRELWLDRAYPGDLKTSLLAAYVDLALEHHKAIWLLRQAKLNGSAIALVRSVFEVMVRGLWIAVVATEEQIDQASRDMKFPKVYKMRDDIRQSGWGMEDAELAELLNRFFFHFDGLWRVLNSYTHSGARHLGRRFIGNRMKPSYTDDDLAQTLNVPTMALLFLMRRFFLSVHCCDEADEIRTLFFGYVEEFNERLNKGQ